MKSVHSKLPCNERGTNNRQQIQCLFWLLNVLFLDYFVEDFVALDNLSSWQLIASEKASNQSDFWDRAVAFKETDNTYGKLHFLEGGIMYEHYHIDPSKIVPHEWKKLQAS